MEKADTAARGKVILATVKGDVHDIGKNLVEIILANNGYDVVNLGIKVPPDALIQAYRKHRPDAIGLSGLLVKSTQQMVITATDLKAAGMVVPLLVGGAALSEKFTRTKIAPAYAEAVCYAKDAMTGLDLMNRLMDPAGARGGARRPYSRRSARRGGDAGRTSGAPYQPAQRQGPHRYSDSGGALSGAPRARRAAPGRIVELHQSVHALRPPPGLQGQFRKGPGRARSQSAGTVPQHGRGEAGGRPLHEGEGRVAVLRGRARRQRRSTCLRRAARRLSIPSPSAGSAAKTGCA